MTRRISIRGGWTRGRMRRLLSENASVVRKGVIALFWRQTQDEKETQHTKHLNHRGFAVNTVKRGSELAVKFKSGEQLTSEDWRDARDITWHHAAQLADVANRCPEAILPRVATKVPMVIKPVAA